MHAGEVRPTLVFCTSGDAGPITSPELATRKNLGEVREREQGAAMALVLQRMAQVLGAGTGASSATVWLKLGSDMHVAAIWPPEATRPVAPRRLPPERVRSRTPVPRPLARLGLSQPDPFVREALADDPCPPRKHPRRGGARPFELQARRAQLEDPTDQPPRLRTSLGGRCYLDDLPVLRRNRRPATH